MAEIVSVEIHPAIGFALIGNSPDGYYIGPESPGVVAIAEGGFTYNNGSGAKGLARTRGRRLACAPGKP